MKSLFFTAFTRIPLPESFVKRKRKEYTKNSNRLLVNRKCRLLVNRKYLEKRFSMMYSRNRQKVESVQDRNLK